MNLEQWKEAARRNLKRLGQRIGQLAPGAVYGALCSASLLPVITAAQQGDFAVVAALGSVVGDVGGNLIASQIQSWRDRSEEQLAAELAHHATANPAWRDALDRVLAELQAPQIVQTTLAEADRAWFGDALRAEMERLGNLARYEALLEGSGTINQGTGNVGAGAHGTAIHTVEGDAVVGDDNLTAGGHLVIAQEGATVVIGEAPVKMTAVDRETALGRYLQHVISHNRYLQLQGIRSGGRLVNIELDRIYIRLRTTRQREVTADDGWLAGEAALAPGERGRRPMEPVTTTETVAVSVEEALAQARRLVVLGDPGSGKTTLLRYLALLYARDMAEGKALVRERLGLAEAKVLPILLPLRQIAAFLRHEHGAKDDTEGHALLLHFLLQSLKNERIQLPEDFFDRWLTKGKAVILLDGLDEVADPDLRRRVSRLVESFTRAYPGCRFVVTSRIVGYSGPARLQEAYTTTTVLDFTLADVEQFLLNWHQLLALGQMEPGPSADTYALAQTRQLLAAIQGNERIRELAINPLMLTVIATVHRDRVKLPDRRAELYGEAVDVLLGKWDEARGVKETPILRGRPFDTGDKRLILQSVALHMHERQVKELDLDELRRLLETMLLDNVRDEREVEQAVSRFLTIIEERTGLLVARGEGVYSFSHLTFQEYLAALAVADRGDYIAYTLARVPDPWWREVILLEAGYLSTQGKERTTQLIQAIANLTQEPALYHNLVLAAECLRDLGAGRVQGNLPADIQQRLRKQLEAPSPALSRWFKNVGTKGWIERRSLAMEALGRAGAGFWTDPYGEPEWITILAGEFWMGSERYDGERPVHRVHLESYMIARVPVSNAQYLLFVQAVGHDAPQHWQDNRPPKGMESHPVVNVTWDDAMAYCRWLSQVKGKAITLPSEAQWEKAARGDKDRREYPWGDTFEATRCNGWPLDLGRTTPVGIFTEGASPYGCLDMVGNVWEWTRSVYASYPYPAAGKAFEQRENLMASDSHRRVLRGGSFAYYRGIYLRCAARSNYYPNNRYDDLGFRVCASPLPPASVPL
jgi:formylglycine-generating enzyme required for sulfatase activity/energy-coupling factor transporter ATP-binding protein EcfA2